ncbi:hypothetical protein [Kribbella speibonae]|uniref:Uncharacterized protein n=1 Tax=Kribbella speibonae TaxID=1572660 RepID=A0ABY2A530_9ACTN|nr:hypothetical protein [Kribbella speibonae]TCC22848.1 hypothetical protein E0H58_20970 [Kribbella speibonae]
MSESDRLVVELSVRILHNSIALDHRQRIELAVDQPMRRTPLEPPGVNSRSTGPFSSAVPQVVRPRLVAELLALALPRTLALLLALVT